MPTRINKEADGQNVIVISYDIQDYRLPQTNKKGNFFSAIVNHLWLKQMSDACENAN